jgi:hypothetical protein
MTQTDPMPEQGDKPRQSDDPFTTGDEMLERAKKVARDIEEKVRQLTDDTKTRTTDPIDPSDPDATEEMPPVN